MTWKVANTDSGIWSSYPDRTIESAMRSVRARAILTTDPVEVLLDVEGVLFVWRDLDDGPQSQLIVYVRQP